MPVVLPVSVILPVLVPVPVSMWLVPSLVPVSMWLLRPVRVWTRVLLLALVSMEM